MLQDVQITRGIVYNHASWYMSIGKKRNEIDIEVVNLDARIWALGNENALFRRRR